MRSARLVTVLLSIVLISSTAVAEEDTRRPAKPTVIQGMTSHYDLKYLPPDRYSGDESSLRGDYELMLDLHIPKEGKGPFPVVIYVHGGSWSGGTKEGQQQFAQELAKRGFAFCSLNYILIPKGIFPQVWWDFHNAVRFLRKNADKYNIDPLRFGAYGLSAGGWVISSGAVPGGDMLATQRGGNGAITAADLVAQGGKVKARSSDDDYAWLKPMRDPAPAWPGEAGGFSALSWDFAYHVARGDAASPSVQQWIGKGAKPKDYDEIVKAGVRLTLTEMTAEKYAGQLLHLPAFFKRETKEASHAIDLDGKPGKLLGEVILDFFERELKSPSARPPSPEIYPVPRVVTGPTDVTMLAPRGATIHYTTDGSEPTTSSPVFKAAFTVNPGAIVRAISAAPGMTPSGATRAHFVQGTPAPAITGPDKLPDAVTGQPYSVTFKSDKSKARWQVLGDVTPYVPWRAKDLVYPNGMKMDAEKGTWSGTPTKPGRYWVQVWVNEAPGTVAGYRNYRWVVTGTDLGDVAKPAGEVNDNNVDLAVLHNWPAKNINELLEAMKAERLRNVSPSETGDKQYKLLVHRDDKAKATATVKAYITQNAALKIAWND